jgi:hypothetical protein
MMKDWIGAFWVCVVAVSLAACGSDSGTAEDAGTGDVAGDTHTAVDVQDETVAADVGLDTAVEPEVLADIQSVETTPGLPTGLPFDLNRTDKGEPLTAEEITQFTKVVTGFYKNTGFFNWVWWTSHGMHPSHDPDMPDYRLYWQDTQAIKEGDTIRFVHTGGADNLCIRTGKLTNAAVAGYFMSGGDPMFGRIVEQYAKGFVALSKGLEWASEEPVVKYLQARAIFTVDHEYEMEGGRKVKVEYGPVKEQEKFDWNAHTIPNDENPYWGPIWVRSMRSKDDVPHMYRTVPYFRWIADHGETEEIKEAAALAVEYLSGFAKDIVDSGYYIRTKDKYGNAYIPKKEDGTDNDLASFVTYETVIPNGECSGKISSAYVGYGESLDNDCGLNDHTFYEDMATAGHYFNTAIIRYLHLAAVLTGLVAGDDEKAKQMLIGAIERADRLMADTKSPPEHKEWYPDLAAWLLVGAASGLPLTSQEARLVMEQYMASAAHYEGFAYWDPWDDSVPDGPFNYKPDRDGPANPDEPDGDTIKHIRLPEMGFILEYCFSPYKNPNGAPLLDCDIVADPAKWGL